MTYGVYNRDLKSVSLSGQNSVDDCKKYLWRDTDVVCSEKCVLGSWEIKFVFHKWRGLHRWRYSKMWILGFVTIHTGKDYYTWADKIVYDPKSKEAQ